MGEKKALHCEYPRGLVSSIYRAGTGELLTGRLPTGTYIHALTPTHMTITNWHLFNVLLSDSPFLFSSIVTRTKRTAASCARAFLPNRATDYVHP